MDVLCGQRFLRKMKVRVYAITWSEVIDHQNEPRDYSQQYRTYIIVFGCIASHENWICAQVWKNIIFFVGRKMDTCYMIILKQNYYMCF